MEDITTPSEVTENMAQGIPVRDIPGGTESFQGQEDMLQEWVPGACLTGGGKEVERGGTGCGEGEKPNVAGLTVLPGLIWKFCLRVDSLTESLYGHICTSLFSYL